MVQWQRDGTNLAAGTNFTLTITNTQIADEGVYSAIISNSYGSLTTSNVTLVTLVKPVVVAPPLSQTVVAGGTLSISAIATGHPLPLSFRWLNGTTSIPSAPVDGTNCFLTLTNVQPPAGTNQFLIRINVTNPAGGFTSPAAIITVLPDSDHDGLPDSWELAHGLDPNDPADAMQDADLDGVTNLQEYRAGTNPQDSVSLLRIGSIDWNSESGVSLRFNTFSNKTYTVQSCSFLPGAPWIRIADVPATSTNRTVLVRDASNQDSGRFYRLVTPHSE
jgi:hypothetical protein